MWFKKVEYPVIDSWYANDIAKVHSYHTDVGEGYDGFKVGPTCGLGGTGLWVDNAVVQAGPYKKGTIVSPGPDEVKFTVTYRYENASGGPIDEEKTISLKLHDRLFESHSVFTRDGKPLAGLPVAFGLVDQSPKATFTLKPEEGIAALWDRIDGADYGIGAVVAPSPKLQMVRQPTGDKREQLIVATETDANGILDFRAGVAWSKAGPIKDGAAWLAYLGGQAQAK
jgi:hypothetical protein